MSSKRVIHTAVVTRIKTHTDHIREFSFEMTPESEFQFRAGQFLMTHLPAPSGGKDILRAYSIASGEQFKTQFRLIVKYIPSGVASEFFWSLNLGDPMRFTGPFGKLFFPEPPAPHLFFLSTGSGLAPHLSYLESFIEKYPQNQFEFLVGVRTQNDFFFESYFKDCSNRYKNFSYQFVLSRPDEMWDGRCGYLQHQIESLIAPSSQAHFFICGNEEMAKATKQCLLDKDIPLSHILVEIY